MYLRCSPSPYISLRCGIRKKGKETHLPEAMMEIRKPANLIRPISNRLGEYLKILKKPVNYFTKYSCSYICSMDNSSLLQAPDLTMLLFRLGPVKHLPGCIYYTDNTTC